LLSAFFYQSREKYADTECIYYESTCQGQCAVPPPPPPTKTKTGVWSSVIGCGQDTFDFISLGSALPQNYIVSEDDFFSGNIEGMYDPTLSQGKSKYFISIGGSNATMDGWRSFLNTASVDVQKFYDQCVSRGIAGVDFDIEEFPDDVLEKVVDLCAGLRNISPSFLIMYTILLGQPKSFASLLNNPAYYDYLTLMLYDGGMYDAKGTGAGCDWDGWAEIFLSKGMRGCTTPLGEPLKTYATDAHLSLVDSAKVLLGVIVDTTGLQFDSSMLQRVNELLETYKGAGLMIWVVPGFATPDSITKIIDLGFAMDPASCIVPDTCPQPKVPCDGTCACKASSCGEKKQGVTDDNCAPCPGQTYWPCDQQGFCECDAKDLRRFVTQKPSFF
jgi:hypothetical protein